MTDRELMAYTVQCVQDIAFGEDLTDEEVLVVCRSIGAMRPEVIDHILGSAATPEEIVEELSPTVVEVPAEADPG